jgi:hypothetical protein
MVPFEDRGIAMKRCLITYWEQPFILYLLDILTSDKTKELHSYLT